MDNKIPVFDIKIGELEKEFIIYSVAVLSSTGVSGLGK